MHEIVPMDPRRSFRARNPVAVAVLLFVIASGTLVVNGSCTPSTPSGQPPLVRLGAANMPRFQAEFDAFCVETRVLLLLSPT
jgi:hypothetical protein